MINTVRELNSPALVAAGLETLPYKKLVRQQHHDWHRPGKNGIILVSGY
jgi:hypothetical protein